MRLALKCSAVLRILFIVNIFLIDWYNDYLFRDTKDPFKNLKLDFDLHFSFFQYVAMIFIIVVFFLTPIIAAASLLRPCSRFSVFIYKIAASLAIYFAEVIFLSVAICRAFTDITYSFQEHTEGDMGLLGIVLKQVLGNPESAAKLQLIDRLEALNFLFPVLSSILFLGYFWQVRRKNISRCNQPVQITE